MYYLQSRYYNPELGRFINADALVATGQGLLGNNMFAYCLNNPVRYKDSQCYLAVEDGDSEEDPHGITLMILLVLVRQKPHRLVLKEVDTAAFVVRYKS